MMRMTTTALRVALANAITDASRVGHRFGRRPFLTAVLALLMLLLLPMMMVVVLLFLRQTLHYKNSPFRAY